MKPMRVAIQAGICLILTGAGLTAKKELLGAAQVQTRNFVMIAHGGAGDYSKVSPGQMAAKTGE